MGAMNAAVLVGNVINRNKTWEEAAVELGNFWTDDNNGCLLRLNLVNGGGMMKILKIKYLHQKKH